MNKFENITNKKAERFLIIMKHGNRITVNAENRASVHKEKHNENIRQN